MWAKMFRNGHSHIHFVAGYIDIVILKGNFMSCIKD